MRNFAAERRRAEQLEGEEFLAVRIDELETAIRNALYQPAHLSGCLWLKNHADVCQCGSHERVNAAMDELRRLVPKVR